MTCSKLTHSSRNILFLLPRFHHAPDHVIHHTRSICRLLFMPRPTSSFLASRDISFLSPHNSPFLCISNRRTRAQLPSYLFTLARHNAARTERVSSIVKTRTSVSVFHCGDVVLMAGLCGGVKCTLLININFFRCLFWVTLKQDGPTQCNTKQGSETENSARPSNTMEAATSKLTTMQHHARHNTRIGGHATGHGDDGAGHNATPLSTANIHAVIQHNTSNQRY